LHVFERAVLGASVGLMCEMKTANVNQRADIFGWYANNAPTWLIANAAAITFVLPMQTA
jgi:hypothetical protein